MCELLILASIGAFPDPLAVIAGQPIEINPDATLFITNAALGSVCIDRYLV
jgi:hypothetical protein